MKKDNKIIEVDEMLEEYDFSGGIRGKYAARLAEQNGYIKLEPKVAEYFKKSEDVNNILMAIINNMPHKELKRRQRAVV